MKYEQSIDVQRSSRIFNVNKRRILLEEITPTLVSLLNTKVHEGWKAAQLEGTVCAKVILTIEYFPTNQKQGTE